MGAWDGPHEPGPHMGAHDGTHSPLHPYTVPPAPSKL